jgi:hypothetical protein
MLNILQLFQVSEENFEDTKGVIIRANWRRTLIQWLKKSDKKTNRVYKTLHRKLTIEQHESHKQRGVILGQIITHNTCIYLVLAIRFWTVMCYVCYDFDIWFRNWSESVVT